jgi:flagellar biosynthesis protein FlhF
MTQQFHRFRGPSFDEAYEKMRAMLGRNAVVVRTAQVREGGILGFLGKRLIELTAAAPEDKPAPVARPKCAAERRYADTGAAPTVGSDASVADSVAFFQRLVGEARGRVAQRRAAGTDVAASNETPAVLAFRKPVGQAHGAADLHREINELRGMLEVLVAESPSAGVPAECAPHYHELVVAGVARTAAAHLIASAVRDSDLHVIREPRVFRERLGIEVRKQIRVTGGLGLHAARCKRVALVGATGVGKTTSLAKLAARYAVRERARVALITADTYRVAAPEQLRVYANIIGLPLQVVNGPKEMAAAVHRFRDHDLVLMDTAGGSQYNKGQLRELREILDAAQLDEVHLVLAATTQLEDQRQIAANFGPLKPTALFFSKLDETRRYGSVYSVAVESGLPISYFGTGQNVPDNLALAQPEMVAELLLGKGVLRGTRGR